jgi:hypothetical protein
MRSVLKARDGRTPGTLHRPSRAAERALRAAAEPRPWLPGPFLIWVFGRVLAVAVLLTAAWVVYDSASSDSFQVRSIHVQGNVLLSQADIEQVAALQGANVFWIDRAEVTERLNRLPLVQRAEVDPALSGSVDVTVTERRPAAFWISGETTYLVDNEGVILKAVSAETSQARACAGQPCDPRLASLPTVSELDPQPHQPGERVFSTALRAAAQLGSALPAVGIQPLAFNWSRDVGLEVSTGDGWRVRFDPSSDVGQQVQTLATIKQHLASTRSTAQLIDVRFGDRPYYR